MLRHIPRLLFSPKSFAEKSIEHDTPERKNAEKGPETALERAAWKQKAILISFFLITSLATTSFVLAKLVNTYEFFTLEHIKIIRLLSISIVAWALMAKLSNNVDTMWGGTLLEKTNESFFKFFYLTGFTIGTFSMFLEPINA